MEHTQVIELDDTEKVRSIFILKTSKVFSILRGILYNIIVNYEYFLYGFSAFFGF